MPVCTHRRTQRGSVTAETAVTMPVLAAFALALCWAISLGIAQVRVVDAARDAARGLARGDDAAEVAGRVTDTAPEGAQLTVDRSGDRVTAIVVAEVDSPSWLLVPLPGVTLRSESTVLVEEQADAPS